MKKFLSSILSCMLPFCAFSSEKEEANPLIDEVHRYVNFINRISHGEDFAQHDAAAALLAPDCKKFFNGGLFARNCKEFVDDLLNVYQQHGSWNIRPAEIILSQEGDAAVMRLFVDTERLGNFTEIVIFRFNDEGLIKEINIVFSKIQEAYAF